MAAGTDVEDAREALALSDASGAGPAEAVFGGTSGCNVNYDWRQAALIVRRTQEFGNRLRCGTRPSHSKWTSFGGPDISY